MYVCVHRPAEVFFKEAVAVTAFATTIDHSKNNFDAIISANYDVTGLLYTYVYVSFYFAMISTYAEYVYLCNKEVICCKCLFRLIYEGCMALSPQPSWLHGLSSLISAPTGCNADSGTEPSCYFICEDVLGPPSDSHRLLVASRMKVYSYCIGIRILLTRRGAEIN
jgi:hypothetical protein